jgi:hypothetical protein
VQSISALELNSDSSLTASDGPLGTAVVGSSSSSKLQLLAAGASEGNVAAMLPPKVKANGSFLMGPSMRPEAAHVLVSSVLEPCDLMIKYFDDAERLDLSVDMSHVILKLSPDVLQMALQV